MFSNGSLIFGIDSNSQKLITSNETRLTIAITDLIISEDLTFNLSQKSIFKKVLDFSRNVSKTYIHPNKKLISKELLDVVHEQKKKEFINDPKGSRNIWVVIFRKW